MRARRFLLVTKALATAGLLAACKKEDYPPPPGNPKGMFATEPDAGGTPPTDAATLTPITNMPANPKGSTYDASPAPVVGAPPLNTPVGNPKGSHYDGGTKKP